MSLGHVLVTLMVARVSLCSPQGGVAVDVQLGVDIHGNASRHARPASDLPGGEVSSGSSMLGVSHGDKTGDVSFVPYMVFIEIESTQMEGDKSVDFQGHCGGTLVAKDWVVTAQHCLQKVKKGVKSPITLKIGTTDNRSKLPKHNYKGVRVETYKKSGFKEIQEDDIAMIKLDRPVDSSLKDVKFANLNIDNTDEQMNEAGSCIGAGWGRTKHMKPNSGSNELLWALLELQPGKYCKDRLKSKNGPKYDSNKMMCALGEDGEAMLKGDSGGPLLCEDKDGSQILAGVSWMSAYWGKIRPEEKTPVSYFTRVSYYRKWIEKVMTSTTQK